MNTTRSISRLVQATLLAGTAWLAGCGVFVPATPGHEPPDAGSYNPVSHEDNQLKQP